MTDEQKDSPAAPAVAPPQDAQQDNQETNAQTDDSPLDTGTPNQQIIDDLAPLSEDDDDLVLEVADNQSFQRVADLTLDEKQEKLKELWKECWNDYQVGDFLDAQDTYQKWMLARIISLDNNGVDVRFDGWPAKWDLRFSWHSSKIAPLRLRSIGYTGQPKAPLRPKYQFDEEQLAQEKIQIETMIERDFERYTARDLTQFVRGRLFVYNDFLMTAIHKDLTDEQQDMIDQYFKSVLRLITAWLRKLPKILSKSLQVLNKNMELFLIDEDLALLECQSEIYLTLKAFFCGCHRNVRIYAYYDRALETYEQMITEPELQNFDFLKARQEHDSDFNSVAYQERVANRDTELYFGSALNYLNYFNANGGFEAFLELLRVGNKKTEDNSNLELMTFEMIQSIIDIFANCRPLLEHSWFDNFIQQIFDIVVERLNKLTDTDLKNIDRQSIPRIILRLQNFLQLTRKREDAAMLTEPLSAQMAVRFMKTQFLEKRIQGCIDLSQLVDRVDVKSLFDAQRRRMIEKGGNPNKIPTSFPNAQGGKTYPTHWLNVEKMRDFIVQEKVIENLFGEHSHPEIFKRATSFVKFLSRKGGMTKEILDGIWLCQDGKHEETVRVIYKVIIDLVPDLPLDLLHYFYEKIEASVTEDLNPLKLNFLKDFTNGALGNEQKYITAAQRSTAEEDEIQEAQNNPMARSMKNMAQAVENPEEMALADYKMFGLTKIWNWVQDGNIKPEMYDQALESLIEILQGQNSSRVRTYFLFKSLQNLKNGCSLYTSLQVLTTALENLDFDDLESQDGAYLNEAQVINGLEIQLGIIDILMQQTTQYFQQVQNVLKDLVKKKLEPKDCSEQVFVGYKNHLASIGKLLETFEYIVLKSKHHVQLKPANVESLWNIFVRQPVFVDDQTQFVSWINKKRTVKMRLPRHIIDQLRQEAIRQGNFQPDIPTSTIKETQLLSVAEQKHLFVNVLCNQNICDYSKFSVGEARCFYQLFRLINQEEGYIEPKPNSLEVITFNEIIGLESLWQLAFESNNEKTRAESRQLLVNLHLKLSPNFSVEDKRAIMIRFLNQCTKVLKSASDKDSDDKPMSEEQRTNRILSVVRIIQQFLHRFEGKKPIKPELKFYGYYHQPQPWTVGVVYMAQGQRLQGKIQVSQFETLGAVRQRVADFFKLDQNEFNLKILNLYVDPDVDDDKYCRDFGMSQQIHLFPNANYIKSEHPKYLIEKDKDLFELIFYLLSPQASSPQIVEPVWDLLQELPVNNRLLERVQTLQGVQEEGWETLLDSSSTSKLLYCLKIMDGLTDKELKKILVNSEQPMIDWRNRFVELGGFKHLLDTFCSLSDKQIDGKLTLKCFDQLVRALEQFAELTEEIMNPDDDQQGIIRYVLENKRKLILGCLKTVHEIARFTIKIEQDRGESFEKMMQRKKELKASSQKARFKNSASKEDSDDEDQAESDLTNKLSSLTKEFTYIRQLVERIFNLMGSFVVKFDRQSLSFISEYDKLEEFFTQALILSENLPLRSECGKRIREILINCSGDETLRNTIILILKALLKDTLDHALKPNSRCSEFFTNLRRGIEDLDLNDLLPLQEELFALISTLLGQFYKTPSDNTKVLVGLLNLLKVLLQKFPTKKLEVGQKLLPDLLSEYLFQVPNALEQDKVITQPKFNQQDTRAPAFKVMTVLCRDCLPNLNLVLDFIQEFNKNPSWRTNKQNDWCVMHFDEDKSSTGYVGIKNLGCICYMISLFQQLFNNKGFRESILSIEDPNHGNHEPDENMFLQFQQIFMGLKKSERQYINPKGFTHSFKDWNGQPVNVYEQMDVEEFLGQFLDRLETAIKGTPQEKTISAHFGGKFANEIICKGCPHYYERLETFLSLGVEVKHKKSVAEALNSFIQGDMLEGDNAYMCEKCDKKVDALKRTVVKELPKFMILTLKRFEFDLTTLTKVKVNDYCEFPTELDMTAYTQEGVHRKQEIEKKKQEAQEAGEEFDESSIPLKRPEGYYKYKLNGAVVHQGTADSGHYYSYVREQTSDDPEQSKKWYEFNDNLVTDFDPADLANECFGGDDTSTNLQGVNMKSQKWGNAYLLFYERLDQDYVEVEESAEPKVEPVKKQKTEEEAAAQEIDELLAEEDKDAGKKIKDIFDRQHPIQMKIALENRKYWQNKFLFAQEYFDFVSDLSHSWDTSDNTPLKCMKINDDEHITGQQIRIPSEQSRRMAAKEEMGPPSDICLDLRTQNSPEEIFSSSHKVFKFLMSFYLTIQQRAQNKMPIPNLIGQIKSYLNADPRHGEWVLTEMSNWDIFEEMLLQVQGREMPKLVVGIVYASMLNVYKRDKELLAKHWDGQYSVLANFILTLVANMPKVEPFTANYSNYFHILSRFASLGPEAREFLCKARVAGRCLDFFFGKLSIYRDNFKSIEDLGQIVEQGDPEMGLPTKIDLKVMTYFAVLREKKRLKEITNAMPKHKFLLETVSYCVLHLAFDSPYGIDDSKLTDFVDSNEATLFFADPSYIGRMVAHARKTRSMTKLCEALLHYAGNDPAKLESLWQTVAGGLKENDYDHIRPFLFLLEKMLSSTMPQCTQMRSKWLSQFMKILQQNAVFFRWTEAAFDFIFFRLINRNPAARAWFYQSSAARDILVDWVNKHNRVPGQGCRLYKDRQRNAQAIQMQETTNTIEGIIRGQVRYKNMQQFLEQGFPEIGSFDDFDLDAGDFQDYKYLVNDTVVLYDRKKDEFTRWNVNTVLDEMISMTCLETDQSMKGQNKWLKTDTDKIIPEMLFLKNHRVKFKAQTKQEWIQQRLAAAKKTQAMKAKQEEKEISDGGSEEYEESGDEEDLYH